jgi:hypothetical protein
MKTRILLGLLVSGSSLHAGEAKGGAPDIHIPLRDKSGWEIGLGVAPIFGADARFAGLGGWQSPNPVPPATGTTDRFYDDGFNRIDDTGNANNLTSYWGYQNEAQYDPSGGGSIAMSIFNSRRTGPDGDDDTGWGGEIFAYRAMGNLSGPTRSGATWGMRLGFHVNDFSFGSRGNLTTSVNVLTDTYGLGGAVPPDPPFSGSPSGFGNALLDGQPARSTFVQTTGLVGSRDFDVTLFGFSAGPYLEFPLTERFAVRAEGGLSLAVAHGKYFHTSATTIAGLPAGTATQVSSGSSRETSLLPGLYLGASGVLRINPQLNAHVGLRYQLYDTFETRAGGSEAKLDFSQAVMLTVGASFAF